jgi:SAM-dependent methyltransferase
MGSRKKSKSTVELSKYKLYEASVQNPTWQAQNFPRFHQWILKKIPRSLREDFCGTGQISCEWVKDSKLNTAVGLDLDPEPLTYGRTENISQLSKEEQSRIELRRENVMTVTREKFDLVAACNFSFFIFHEREELLKYFKAVYASLNKKGSFFLELSGGEGMIEKTKDQRTFKIKGHGKFQYVWEQHEYNTISAVSDYSIHYQLPNRRWMKDVFTYHWRLWGIREVRDVLKDAGFQKSVVFWESLEHGATGDYVPTEKGEHLNTWLAYIVGVKDV